MKKSYTYKFFFYALIGLILCFGIAKCTAQVDKKLHFGAGAVSSAFFSTFSMPQNEIWKPAIFGMIGATGLGVSKELLDLAGFGTPEWADLGATMLGGIIATTIIIIVKVVVKITKRRIFIN